MGRRPEPHQDQPAGRPDAGNVAGAREGRRRAGQPAACEVLSLDRLRALHPRDQAGRAGTRRTLVVGAGRAARMRAAPFRLGVGIARKGPTQGHHFGFGHVKTSEGTSHERDRTRARQAAARPASQGSRKRGDPHLPRGGGRIRASGDALFDRQGFLGAAAPGAEGVPSGQAAVSAGPYRHRLEVSRNDRLPRPGGGQARAGPDRPHQSRGPARSGHAVQPRVGALHRHHEDASLEAGARHGQVRRGLRRRAARRGSKPRQGADLFVPHPRPCLGSAQPASGTLVDLQRQ